MYPSQTQFQPGEQQASTRALEALAEDVAEGAGPLGNICPLPSDGKPSTKLSPIIGLWVLDRLGPAQAPARQLGTMARACLADGSRNAAMFSAAQQKPKNSERDAHNIFKRYWLSLRVPISYLEVPPQDDGICTTIPCYKAGCGFRVTDLCKFVETVMVDNVYYS